MQIEHFINQIDLTLDPPTEEPLRQYYFIAKARTLVAQMEKEAGRKMTFCVNTFGCQMNARDSEKLDRKSTRLNSSHTQKYRMPSSA